MGDSFVSTLREFEKTVAEITQTTERLRFLEWERDRLRKDLRAYATGNDTGRSVLSFADARPPRSAPSQLTRSMLQVQEALKKIGGEGTLVTIAEQLELPPKTVATRLQRAVERGAVERSGHGLYKLLDENIAQLVVENDLEDVPPTNEQSPDNEESI
jgi:hypothetical protein